MLFLNFKEANRCQPEDSSNRSYYDKNAANYVKSTQEVDMSALYKRFIRYLPKGGRILDVGSGSGRDTLAFLKRGHSVEAFDASPMLAKLSSQITGIETKVMRFEELKEVEKYDGIWACASLLHVREKDLPIIVSQLARALRVGGAIYMSFKLGPGERISMDGRFFTDMDEARLSLLIKCEPMLDLEEIWITEGEDLFKGQDIWLNAISVKHSTKATSNATN